MSLKKRIYFLAATIWIILITIASLLPLSGATDVKSPISDKVVHAAFYMGATVLWYLYIRNKKIRHAFLKIFLCAVSYGIIIETLQAVMPFGRHFETKDIFANTIGSFIGIVSIKTYLICSRIALKVKK